MDRTFLSLGQTCEGRCGYLVFILYVLQVHVLHDDTTGVMKDLQHQQHHQVVMTGSLGIGRPYPALGGLDVSLGRNLRAFARSA